MTQKTHEGSHFIVQLHDATMSSNETNLDGTCISNFMLFNALVSIIRHFLYYSRNTVLRMDVSPPNLAQTSEEVEGWGCCELGKHPHYTRSLRLEWQAVKCRPAYMKH